MPFPHLKELLLNLGVSCAYYHELEFHIGQYVVKNLEKYIEPLLGCKTAYHCEEGHVGLFLESELLLHLCLELCLSLHPSNAEVVWYEGVLLGIPLVCIYAVGYAFEPVLPLHDYVFESASLFRSLDLLCVCWTHRRYEVCIDKTCL